MIPPFAKVNPLSEAVAVDLTRAIQILFHSCVVVGVTVANPLREAVTVDLAMVTKIVVVVAGANPLREAVVVDLAGALKVYSPFVLLLSLMHRR